jgi:hypothetical protein
MSAKLNLNNPFVYRCKQHLELLSRNEKFKKLVDDVKYDQQVRSVDYRSRKKRLEFLSRQDNRFKHQIKRIIFEAHLDSYWFCAISHYVLCRDIDTAITEIPETNGIRVEYVWDNDTGGEAIKLTLGMKTTTPQLNKVMGAVLKLQKKHSTDSTKIQRSIKKYDSVALLAFDIKKRYPDLKAREIADKLNESKLVHKSDYTEIEVNKFLIKIRSNVLSII